MPPPGGLHRIHKLSLSLLSAHIEKMQLKKKLMRHISCIPAQFLAVKAFTTFTQEDLTQLRRCWLSNSTWQKWNPSKLWTVAFNEHHFSQSNYWKYAMHYIQHGHVIFQMGLNVPLASSQNGHCMLIKMPCNNYFLYYSYCSSGSLNWGGSPRVLMCSIHCILLFLWLRFVGVLNFAEQSCDFRASFTVNVFFRSRISCSGVSFTRIGAGSVLEGHAYFSPPNQQSCSIDFGFVVVVVILARWHHPVPSTNILSLWPKALWPTKVFDCYFCSSR